ncbi:MAG: carboxypeptidase-like regulatory domain-containing protein, partial [Tannerellaceae bacterium]|nr:carboxypeptidase-like regulatory domain-containing protein [Tannerellaceae bacterium]
MKKCFYLLVTFVCLAGSVFAAPVVRIRGKIVEAGSNKPIDFADIFLLSGENEMPVYQTLPERDGHFVLTDVGDGSYTLLIRLVGFDVFTRPDILLNASTPL